MLANFATDELGAKKAAVIYDIAADYPKAHIRHPKSMVVEQFKSQSKQLDKTV